jgi:hypothetical protein
MRVIFAVFGLALIMVGSIILFVPREEARPQTRSINTTQVISLAARARDIADQVNGPLSILFGLISLYYSRKRYIVERESHGKSEQA